MAVLSDLVTDVIGDIPEVPGFVAERQYIRALRQLCEEARVWRIEDTMSTVADAPNLLLTAIFPNNTELVDVLSIKPVEGGSSVKPKTQAYLDLNESDWRDQTGQYATWYMLASNNTIRLVPTPSEVVTYYIRAAIKPTFSATTISDIVVNKYEELLIHGAKAYLFMVPRKPWTDLQLAQYHQAAFLAGIPGARSEAADEFQTGVARKVKYGGL
jgi:hypothetical protein